MPFNIRECHGKPVPPVRLIPRQHMLHDPTVPPSPEAFVDCGGGSAAQLAMTLGSAAAGPGVGPAPRELQLTSSTAGADGYPAIVSEYDPISHTWRGLGPAYAVAENATVNLAPGNCYSIFLNGYAADGLPKYVIRNQSDCQANTQATSGGGSGGSVNCGVGDPISGLTNNMDVSSALGVNQSGTVILNPTGATILTGMQTSPGSPGAPNCTVITLYNPTINPITVFEDSGLSVSGDRYLFGAGTLIIDYLQSATFFYFDGFWCLLAYNNGTGGGATDFIISTPNQTTSGGGGTYPVGPEDSILVVSIGILVTATGGNFTVLIKFTDVTGAPQTITLPYVFSGGGSGTSVAAAGYYGFETITIVAQANSTVYTIPDPAGMYTGITYNFDGYLRFAGPSNS